MNTFIAIAQLVIVISALIILHELGHFLAARFFKIEVEEFGIGFPPRVLTLFEAGGTKYSLNWLPLGGFVKIKGEGNPDVPGGLAASSPWVRLAVYLAGPVMNLLIGVVLYAVIFGQLGTPDPTQVLIVEVAVNSPAEQAGLQAGDIIKTVDGQDINSMDALHEAIFAKLEETIIMAYGREGKTQETSMVPRADPPVGEGAIGIAMSNPTQPTSWFVSLPMGAIATFDHAVALVTLPAQVVRGSVAPEDARLVGYKGMYDIYQEVREKDIVPGRSQSFSVIWFFTTITISLGVINLLPIPALDGGRILFTLPEIVLRRRIPIDVQNWINMISFTALILLFLYINIMDFANPVQLP